MSTNFPGIPLNPSPHDLAIAVQNILTGKTNNTGTITLTANAACTMLSDERIGANTVVLLVPTTGNAAAALTGIYQTYPNSNKNQAVINHANNGQTDRVFRFILIG